MSEWMSVSQIGGHKLQNCNGYETFDVKASFKWDCKAMNKVRQKQAQVLDVSLVFE